MNDTEAFFVGAIKRQDGAHPHLFILQAVPRIDCTPASGLILVCQQLSVLIDLFFSCRLSGFLTQPFLRRLQWKDEPGLPFLDI